MQIIILIAGLSLYELLKEKENILNLLQKTSKEKWKNKIIYIYLYHMNKSVKV